MMVSLDALRWQNRLLGDELGLDVAQLAVHIEVGNEATVRATFPTGRCKVSAASTGEAHRA